MATKKFCMRCGKEGVRTETDTEEIVTCVNHGVIYRAPLSAEPPEQEGALMANGDAEEEEIEGINNRGENDATGEEEAENTQKKSYQTTESSGHTY